MTFTIALLVLASLATVLLVLAGRESLRTHGFAPQPVRRVGDLAHLIAVGYDELNYASAEAARKRLSRLV